MLLKIGYVFKNVVKFVEVDSNGKTVEEIYDGLVKNYPLEDDKDDFFEIRRDLGGNLRTEWVQDFAGILFTDKWGRVNV